MNEVQLVGRVGSQIRLQEVSTRIGLRPRATFVLAVARPVREEVEPNWLRVEAWGSQADNLVKYCGKGSLIGVAGHLRGHYFNAEAQERGGELRMVVVADAISYLDRRPAFESHAEEDGSVAADGD